MTNKYPSKEEIKVEWTKTHSGILATVTFIAIASFIYEVRMENISFSKCFTIVGLYIDIIGVLVASLKTPYYGSFYDGGQIERERQKVEGKYFQWGMFLIAFGMIFQLVSTLV